MELKSHNKSAHECKQCGIYFPCSSNLKHTRRVLRRVMIVDFGSLLMKLKSQNKSSHEYEHCGMQFVLHVTLLGKSSRCVMIVEFNSLLMELKSHNKSAHECKHCGIYFPCSSNLKHTRRVLRRVMIVDLGSLLM